MRKLNNKEKEKLKAFSKAIDRRINQRGFLDKLLSNTEFRKKLALETVETFLTTNKKEFEDAFVSGGDE